MKILFTLFLRHFFHDIRKQIRGSLISEQSDTRTTSTFPILITVNVCDGIY